MLFLQSILVLIALFWIAILGEQSRVDESGRIGQGKTRWADNVDVTSLDGLDFSGKLMFALAAASILTTIVIGIGCGAIAQFDSSWLTSVPMVVIYICGTLSMIATIAYSHSNLYAWGRVLLIGSLVIQMTTIYPIWLM